MTDSLLTDDSLSLEGFGSRLYDGIEASEIGNSERLILIAKGKIHWVDAWKTWIIYEDGRWIYDYNGIVLMEYAKRVIRKLYYLCDEIRPAEEVIERVKGDIGDANDIFVVERYKAHLAHVKKSESEPMMRRMGSLARGIPGIAVTPADIDAHPWLFNCQGRTINLLTGVDYEPDPGDLLMQQSPVVFDRTATAPLWEGYLTQWQEHSDVRDFLQKICASAITGIPLSKVFINIGSGQNGKSVFFDVLTQMLGTYAIVPDESLFMDSRNDAHSEEKAKLKGARMMTINETDKNGRLNEPAIKKYNGGDLINGRHLYGRPFSFEPTHTAFMHTNHIPYVAGTDLGIWRRIALIEWNFTVPSAQVDPDIKNKLRSEWAGILNWLIAGIPSFKEDMSIQRIPDRIVKVGEEYRQTQDHVGNFLRDVYDGGFLVETASALRTKYEAWCSAEGLKAWAAPSVGKELTKRNYVSKLKKTDGKPMRTWFYTSPEVSVTPLPDSNVTESSYTKTSVTSVTPLPLG